MSGVAVGQCGFILNALESSPRSPLRKSLPSSEPRVSLCQAGLWERLQGKDSEVPCRVRCVRMTIPCLQLSAIPLSIGFVCAGVTHTNPSREPPLRSQARGSVFSLEVGHVSGSFLPACLGFERTPFPTGPRVPGFGGGAGGSHRLGPCSPTRLMWFLSCCCATYSHIMCAHVTHVHTWQSAHITCAYTTHVTRAHITHVHALHTCTCTHQTHTAPLLSELALPNLVSIQARVRVHRPLAGQRAPREEEYLLNHRENLREGVGRQSPSPHAGPLSAH